MRLTILDHGHRLRARLFLAATSAPSRVDSPDIVKTLLYRPDFFSRPLLELTAPAMRGPSFWTSGEREYLAMRTAQEHRCPFCIDAHTELTRIAGNGEISPDDPASARPELVAVEEFLTGLPDAPPPAGLPEAAVVDALRVRLVWNIVNRLANAFGFVMRPGQLHSGTRALHRFGYRFPGVLLSGGSRAGRVGDAVADLRHAVFDGPGDTDVTLRRAAGTGQDVPEPWRRYVGLVRDSSYRITSTDIGRIISAGHTEDEVYEVTVAAAVGAALADYDAGRRALGATTAPGS